MGRRRKFTKSTRDRRFITRDEHSNMLYICDEKPELINGVWISEDAAMQPIKPEVLRLLGHSLYIAPCEICEIEVTVHSILYDANGQVKPHNKRRENGLDL